MTDSRLSMMESLGYRYERTLAESERLRQESERLLFEARQQCYASLCAHLNVDSSSTTRQVLCEGRVPAGGCVRFEWRPDHEGRFTIGFTAGSSEKNPEALPMAMQIWNALLNMGTK